MIDLKMHSVQRHNLILRKIQETGFVKVPEMAKECGVSEMTMRRDLDRLANLELVIRRHGGAAAVGRRQQDLSVSLIAPSFKARSKVNHQAKVAIAEAAVKHISSGHTIALDVGTTTYELARLLEDQSVSVVTNSLRIAVLLSQKNHPVYVPGGRAKGTELSIVGAQTVENLSRLYFDLAFLGLSGVSCEGFFDYALEDSEIKKTLISSSRNSIVLLDSTKFNRISGARASKLEEIDIMITDSQPPANLQEALSKAKVNVEIA